MIFKRFVFPVIAILLVLLVIFLGRKEISPPRIYGGIVPHHLFADDIISDFFSRFSYQKPKTIIVIGPNHLEKGNFMALTSLKDDPNSGIIKKLVDANLVKVDEKVLAEDQSTDIIPIIKSRLPGVKVVPILLSGFMSEGDTRILSDTLKNFIDKDTVLVASVDFSHGLTSPNAKEKDKITLGLIKDFNYNGIRSLGNEYLDSPPSIAVLLMTMQSLGKTGSEVLYNTNSGEIQSNDSIETTSYFSIVYH